MKWTNELSIGNALIDSGHKSLLEIAGAVIHSIEAEDCVAFSRGFELLENALRAHEAKEEHIAQRVRFPYARYRAAEQHFRKELDLFKQELLARKCQCCEDAIKHYSDALKGLMVDHISEKGRLMKPFLQNFPYEVDAA